MFDSTLYRKRKRPAETFLLAAIYGAASISVFLCSASSGMSS